jgi:hypothetical protein
MNLWEMKYSKKPNKTNGFERGGEVQIAGVSLGICTRAQF